MQRYAFIDAQNTANTTEHMLGFFVDWHNLCHYLATRWHCERIFLYVGIHRGDHTTEDSLASLDQYNCTIRAKEIKVYKNPDKHTVLQCPHCGTESGKVVDMGYRSKANCDVELTMDVIDHAGPNTELLIFTGDGDFADVIEHAVHQGAKVKLVSHAKVYKTKAGTIRCRFATKLRKLIKQYPQQIALIDIARWQHHIRTEEDTETSA